MLHATLFSRPKQAGGEIIRRKAVKPIQSMRCTIRAYPAHAKELNNPAPDSVIFFYKPSAAAFQLQDKGVVPIPTRFGSCHHEIEICVLIGSTPLPDPVDENQKFDPIAIRKSINGVGLGLDWTLRDVQQKMSKGGLPWERAKAFTRSGAVTEFLDVTQMEKQERDSFLGADNEPGFPKYEFSLFKNGKSVQQGNTADISFDILSQIWEMHKVTKLSEGDVVMTGTPTGVGPVEVGDDLRLKCDKLGLDVSVKVIPESKL
jgi:2-keto-4-pentenoate hydratase/2-oxohepta-3-ene-1,7-dioic acid hydratase in catechol pathway